MAKILSYRRAKKSDLPKLIKMLAEDHRSQGFGS